MKDHPILGRFILAGLAVGMAYFTYAAISTGHISVGRNSRKLISREAAPREFWFWTAMCAGTAIFSTFVFIQTLLGKPTPDDDDA
jgi:hypothetical protein